jgi:hypothetical protein
MASAAATDDHRIVATPLREEAMTMSTRNRAGRLAVLAGIAVAALGVAPAAAGADVKAYPQETRYLTGLWDSEHVPAYTCPNERRYLENRYYKPAGTMLIPGVEIQQERDPWPIGVSISQARYTSYTGVYAAGISDSWIDTSATNWTFGTNWYRVVLHCTDDRNEANQIREDQPPWPL